MTLHERVQLLMSAFLVLLALAGVVGAVTVGQRDHLVMAATRYDTARDQANQLLTDYVAQETSLSNSIIGSAGGAPRFEEGPESDDAMLATLRQTLQDDPELRAIVDDIDAAAQAWHEEGVRPQLAAAGRSGQEAAQLAANQVRLFDEVVARLATLRSALGQAEADVEQQLGVARRQINAVIVVAFATGGLLLWATSVALVRWSSKPLAEISAAMRDVTDGDLNRRIPAVGPSDIAALGEDAELMRRRIVTELDSARRAEQALRSQGAIVSVLREELGPSQQALPPSVSMSAGFEPVVGVLAGDWYDVLTLDDGAVALCLIDVSGHGQSTGVFALQAKNLMLAGARQLLSPGAVLEWMARALGDTGDDFLTCFIARIDPDTGSCEYASAGHLPALVTSGRGVVELGPTGPLLGPLPGQWSTERIELEPAGSIVVYTDGVTEARGPGNEEFGEDRLRAVVAARAGEHPTNIVATCLDAVHDFARGDANDDLTIVAVRWLPRE